MHRKFVWVPFWVAFCGGPVAAQGPSPENGATLFPGGAYFAYGAALAHRSLEPRRLPNLSVEIARPTSERVSAFYFGWGIRRDFQLTAMVPYSINRLELDGRPALRTSGLGDVELLVKHRFFRRDSERGTTQLSIAGGPRLPIGGSSAGDPDTPAALEPRSRSAGLRAELSGTYTGLFHIKRLVADGTLDFVRHGRRAREVRLGDELEARFWLSYRPYQAQGVGREWFVGPTLAYARSARDRQRGVRIAESGGNALLVGLTNYFSPHAGIVLWLALDFPVWQQVRVPLELERRIRFGVTKQFVIHH